jgi:NADPH:quinone reductase-like Zn-dependent oxidoreductase
MKAIVQERYGAPHEVLTLRDFPVPVAKDDEVLVRICAAGVHVDVWHAVTALPRILRLMGSGVVRPKIQIPGTDLAGVVEYVGKRVAQFKPGDEVFGVSMRTMLWGNGRTFCEYAAVPWDTIQLKPARVSFEQAASVTTSGIIMMMNLPACGEFQPRRRVLINGAGGNVGSNAVQIFKARGAHVTGVDHPSRFELMRSHGADELIDYTQEDFTRRPERYDLIFDVASTLATADWKRALVPTGRYVRIGHDHFGANGRRTFGSIPGFFALYVGRALFLRDRQLARLDMKALPTYSQAVAAVKRLLDDGTLEPFVDKTFPLADAVAAIRYLMEGRNVGKVVLQP